MWGKTQACRYVGQMCVGAQTEHVVGVTDHVGVGLYNLYSLVTDWAWSPTRVGPPSPDVCVFSTFDVNLKVATGSLASPSFTYSEVAMGEMSAYE